MANVTPVLKNGDRNLSDNQLYLIVKLFETINRDKVINYLECYSLILDTQHGFRNNKSFLSNILTFSNELFAVCDVSRSLNNIYLNSQRGFDKVPHYKLFHKIK